MDRDAVREYAASVRQAGYAADRFRWRLPLTDLAHAEREEALRRWPSAGAAVRWLGDGLADTWLTQAGALRAGMHAECFVMVEALAPLFESRSMYSQARCCYELGLDAARALEDRDAGGMLSTRMGLLHALDGDPRKAASWYQSAHRLHAGTGHRPGIAAVLGTWAAAEIMSGNFTGAREMAERAREIFAAGGDARGVAIADRRLALLHTRLGRIEQALAMYPDLIACFDDRGDEVMAAQTHAEYAQALTLAGQGEAALREIAVAFRVFADYSVDRDVVYMDELRAAAHTQLGDHDRARDALLNAYRGYTRIGTELHAQRLIDRLVTA